MMSDITITRLHSAIAAAAPILGVCILDHDAKQVRIDYVDSATSADKVNGDAALAAFDWSDAQDASFLAVLSTKVAQNSIDRGITKDGVALDRLVAAVALVTLDEVNNIRANIAAASLAPRTQAQLLGAIKAKLAGFPT